MTRLFATVAALVIFAGLLHPNPIAPHATSVTERCK